MHESWPWLLPPVWFAGVYDLILPARNIQFTAFGALRNYTSRDCGRDQIDHMGKWLPARLRPDFGIRRDRPEKGSVGVANPADRITRGARDHRFQHQDAGAQARDIAGRLPRVPVSDCILRNLRLPCRVSVSCGVARELDFPAGGSALGRRSATRNSQACSCWSSPDPRYPTVSGVVHVGLAACTSAWRLSTDDRCSSDRSDVLDVR